MVATGDGYVIDIRNNRPFLATDPLDRRVLRFEDEAEAGLTVEQLKRLGYAASVVPLRIGKISI